MMTMYKYSSYFQSMFTASTTSQLKPN